MYCKKCGAQINDGALFCKKCGAEQSVILANEEAEEQFDSDEVKEQEIWSNTSFGKEIEQSEAKKSKSGSHIPSRNKKNKRKQILIISAPILLIAIILFVIFGMPQSEKSESVNASDLNSISAKLKENAKYFEKNIVGMYQAANGGIVEFGSDTMLIYKKDIPIGEVDGEDAAAAALAKHQAEADSIELRYYKIYDVDDLSEEGLKKYAEYIKDGEIWAFLECTNHETNVYLARFKDDILTIQGPNGAWSISPLTRITKENKMTDDVVGLYLSESTNDTIVLLKDDFYRMEFIDSTSKVIDSSNKVAVAVSGYKVIDGNIVIYGADTLKIEKQSKTLVVTAGSQTDTYRKISNMDYTSEFGVSIYDAKLSVANYKKPNSQNTDSSSENNNNNDSSTQTPKRDSQKEAKDAMQSVDFSVSSLKERTQDEILSAGATVTWNTTSVLTDIGWHITEVNITHNQKTQSLSGSSSSFARSIDIALNPGNNNITIELKDNYGNSRTITKTTVFDPLPPEIISIIPVLRDDNKSFISVTITNPVTGSQYSSHYNAAEKLTVTINGTTTIPETAWRGGNEWDMYIKNLNLPNTKTYKVVLTNKYGVSTTRTVTFP